MSEAFSTDYSERDKMFRCLPYTLCGFWGTTLNEFGLKTLIT